MSKLNIDQNLKLRIDNLYSSLWKAEAEGKDTVQHQRRILKLEKRYKEQAFGITLTEIEIKELKAIVNFKSVFPGSNVIGISSKPTFWTLYSQYKNRSNSLNTTPTNGEGGEENMGFTIDVQIPMPVGENEAIISVINTVDGKWGPRLHIVFQDEEERTASGFFPMKATESNNLGKLLRAVFGKIQKIESDELLEQRVKVFVEHHEKDDKTYANVTDFV